MTTLAAGTIPAPYEQETAREVLPRLTPTPRFLLAHHPEQWVVLGGRLVPALRKRAIQPGVSRVDSRGRPHDAIAMWERKGWTVIPEDVDGKGTSYLRAYRVIPRGDKDPEYTPSQFAHLDRWERAYPGSAHIGEGGEDYAEWSASLVDRGIVAPPLPHVLERMTEETQRQIGQYRDKLHAQPSLRGVIEVLEGHLEVIAAAYAAALDDVAPAEPATPAPLQLDEPKPKRPRKGKGANDGE